MRTLIAGFAALLMTAGAAFGEECTEEAAEAKSAELFAMIEADPTLAPKLEGAVAEVEAEYGGEPTPEQTCEAIQKLMDKLGAE